MAEEMVVIRMFNNELEASVARAELEASGIHSLIVADAGGSQQPPHLQFANGVHLAVHSRDADNAERVLSQGNPS